MRALQAARIPDRVARQDFRDRLEHLTVAGVAADILLAVDVAAVTAHRRVAHPPPRVATTADWSWIGHRKTLQ